jgi:ATP/maltotriose-dependent transcriptional regulator MalT
MMAARYDEAFDVIAAGLNVARTTQLDFVLPHALLVKAGIAAGLKRYGTANAALRDSLALAPDDEYVTTNASALRARILCMSGNPRLAADHTDNAVSESVTRSVRAEYQSAHGLALACMGQVRKALHVADEIPTVSATKEANSLALGIRLICALQGDDDASGALTSLVCTDFLDPVVVVYRSFPTILQFAANVESARPLLEALTRRAHDESIAVATGLSEPVVPRRLSLLTNRERHVLQLIAEGSSNREIAEHLVISEATVKVHVHRILTKLGVRSRTEAVIQTAEHVL